MAGEVKIPIGLNTDTALKDAKRLGEDVKRTLSNVDMTQANSKTLTFVKNLTTALNRMQKLVDEAEKLAATPVYSEKYLAMSKTLEQSSKRMEEIRKEQDKMLDKGRKYDPHYKELTAEMERLKESTRTITEHMHEMEMAEQDIVSGKNTQAYKDKAKALNVQNQAINILLTRYEEMNGASKINVSNTNQETETIQRQTRATRELSEARKELSGGKGGVKRGPSVRGPQVTKGPGLEGGTVSFKKQGETVAEIQHYTQAQIDAANATENTTEAVGRSKRAMDSYGSTMGEIGKNILSRVKNALNRLVMLFKKLSSHLHSSHKSHSGLMGDMKHSLSMILRYTLGIRSLFMLIRRIRSYVKEAFKVMAQEIPEVNEAISMLGTSFKQLKAAFGTMLQPLLQALAPVLNALIQKIVHLMNAVARFFATLTGQNYIYEATVANYDYAKSVEEAEKANENALASFDKLNVIAKDNAKNTLALNKDTVTYEKVEIDPEDNWYTRLAEKIAKGWKDANLTEAGSDIAEKIGKLLDDINWDEVRTYTTKFPKRAATFINGLTVQDAPDGHSSLAKSIGNFLGNVVQLAIDNVHEFVTDLDWKALGDFIGTSIDSLKTTFKNNETWKKAGETIGEFFQGLVEFGIELFVKHNIFEGLGKNLGDMLDSALKKGLEINPETGNTYLRDFGMSLSKGFTDLLQEIEDFLDSNAVQNRLPKAINELVQGIDLMKIFKQLATVFIKGFFTGLKLVVSAGLGALGINADEDTVTFIAEALGIGILGKKIAGLVTGITGSGGLLSAFGKKDNALKEQTRKTTTESGAVKVLSSALGLLGIGSLITAGSLGTLSDKVGDATLSFSDLAEGGKIATKELEQDTKIALDNTKAEFENFTPKVNEVDTTAYTNFIDATEATIQTIKDKWANANIKGKVTVTTAETSTVPEIPKTETKYEGEFSTPHSYASESAAKFYEGYAEWEKNRKTTPATTPSTAPSTGTNVAGAPYYELNQQAYQNKLKRERGEDWEKYVKQSAHTLNNFFSSIPNEDELAAVTKEWSDICASSGYSDMTDLLADVNMFEKCYSDLVSFTRTYEASKSSGNSSGLFGNIIYRLYQLFDPLGALMLGNVSEQSLLNSAKTGAKNLLDWLSKAASMASYFPIPFLAQGAVIPANKPFMAVLGDQRQGTNIEAPLSTIEKAVANVLSNMTVKAEFDVSGDPNGIFKVVQKKARVFYNQTQQNPFDMKSLNA